VVLELPPGPGIERLLGDPAVFEAVRRGLSDELGRAILVEVRQHGGNSGGTGIGQASGRARITPEKVKSDQLARLSQSEPALRSAVREWDLELMD